MTAVSWDHDVDVKIVRDDLVAAVGHVHQVDVPGGFVLVGIEVWPDVTGIDRDATPAVHREGDAHVGEQERSLEPVGARRGSKLSGKAYS
jgi:hypothetical protein